MKAIISPGKKIASTGVFWKSSNPKVATVSTSGKVKGVKKGTAKITATATDGSGKKAVIRIKVK
jgi:endo-1,4-beta-xylanase